MPLNKSYGLVTAGALLCLGVWLWLGPKSTAPLKGAARGDTPAEQPSQATAPVGTPAAEPVAQRTESTAPTAAAAPTAPVGESLEPVDDGIREKIEGYVAANDISKLDVLIGTDVSRELDAAPAVIDGIARLAKNQSPAVRQKAAGRLAEILKTERVRAGTQGIGAAGNVSVGIDALGLLGGDESGAALAEALDTANYALHHETRMVQELGKMRYLPAAASIGRFAERTKSRQSSDSFEQELKKEALLAADEALLELKRRQ